MIKRFIKRFRKFWWGGYWNEFRNVQYNTVRSKFDQEEILRNRIKNPLFLEQYGAKSFSQNDEDGIIAEIFNRIGIHNKTFVEFGVEDGLECCTHLLLYQGFKGGWIEGDPAMYSKISKNFKNTIQKGQLSVCNSFVTVQNINDLIKDKLKMEGEIDLLSIDIVGNDYHVFRAINVINPRIVIIPYNAKFLPSVEWVMKYNEKHRWDGSDLQYASLKSIEILAKEKGYSLVGTNINGVNAFLVRNDLVQEKFPIPATSENLWNPARKWFRYQSGFHSEKTDISLLEYSNSDYLRE